MCPYVCDFPVWTLVFGMIHGESPAAVVWGVCKVTRFDVIYSLDF